MKRELDWIQALRGIAALLVVICHARVVLRGTPYEAFAERAMTPGALGVDLFFMISGFIMTYTTAHNDGSIRYTAAFLIKRLARIWPVYVAAVIANLMLSPTHFGIVLSSWDLSRLYLKSLMFLPNDATKPPFFDMPYAVGWTLNFEIYFYLVFAVSLLFGKLRWVALAVWFIFTLIILPIHMTGHAGLNIQVTNGFSRAYFVMVTNPIIWEFAIGAAIGLLYNSDIALPKSVATYALLAASITFALWYDFSWHGTFNGLDQWGVPLPFMLIVMALASKRIELKVPRMLVWLGGVSYSLYLFHPIAADGLEMAILTAGHAGFIHTWWGSLSIILFAVAVAYVANKLFEEGLSKWVRKWLLHLLDLFNRHPEIKGVRG